MIHGGIEGSGGRELSGEIDTRCQKLLMWAEQALEVWRVFFYRCLGANQQAVRKKGNVGRFNWVVGNTCWSKRAVQKGIK